MLKNWKTSVFLGCAIALCGVGGDQSAPVATAAVGEGFMPAENYPHRDPSYDAYLKDSRPLPWGTFVTLYDHIAFPQSRGAMVSLMGWPMAYDGAWEYYPLPNGNEVAVYYVGDTATHFTVGY